VAQQGPPPRRPSSMPSSGRPDLPDDPNMTGRREGTGRHGRPSSHRGPSLDERPDVAGYDDADRRGYEDPGQPGYPDTGRHGHAAPQSEYADPRSDYAGPPPEFDDPQPEYAAPRTEYEAPRADYDGAPSGYDRPRSPVTERHGGAARPARGARPGRGEREAWDQDPFSESGESEAPPWAGPSIYATRAGGRRMGPPTEQPQETGPDAAAPDVAAPAPRRRRGRGRAAAARLRKSRRRVYILCGTAIVVAVIIAVIAVIAVLPSPAPKSSFINTLQPGEYKGVPNACTAVSSSLLSQTLTGQARKVTPTGNGSTSSQCSFTVDHRPVFRVLQITIQAFQPSLVVAGNGSATAGATDAYVAARQALASPSKKSPLPKASITSASGLGQEAISALQVLHRGRTVTDLITVVARERNVLLTVFMQAQTSGGGYGPVSASALAGGTQTVAKAVLAKAGTEPTVKKG
jgi:hypothetical protein